MRLYDKQIAGVVWLQKFTIFSPQNLSDDDTARQGVVQWGNYAISNNLYPNLFNILAKYSPTTEIMLNKAVRLAFGNIPKEIKNKKTTRESVFTNTIQSVIKNAGRDAFLYNGSFALLVGYDDSGKCDEFRWVPLELLRYVKRDAGRYPLTDNEYMLAIMDSETNKVSTIHYPYEPGRVLEQQQGMSELDENDKLKPGQILFYNTAESQVYPDCIFNSMLPVLLSDAGIDTVVMSFLANSEILKTYKKNPGTGGADAVNGLGGLFDGQALNSIWGFDNSQSLTATPQVGSDFYRTGVKSAGSTDLVAIREDESINDYVKEATFPQFADELSKLDERIARKICIALEIPYEYVYKMESGVVNQDNREIFIKELNMLFEDPREIFENVINSILEISVFDWRLSIRPIGEGKEDVARANENITE